MTDIGKQMNRKGTSASPTSLDNALLPERARASASRSCPRAVRALTDRGQDPGCQAREITSLLAQNVKRT
ncbi:MAG TPA: hypothetical protein VHM19_00065, partial [Polyangiales bacterium]|nr:hypothetical protein [Polyangiales bacterium]